MSIGAGTEAEDAGAAGAVQRLRRRLSRHLGWNVAVLASTVLVAVTALLGGLDEVRSGKQIPGVAVGAPVETGPVRFAVTGARVTSAKLGPIRATAPADRWIVVLVTATGTWTESYRQLSRHLQLEGVNGITEQTPTVLSVDDGYFVDGIEPGLPVRLAYAWPQDTGATVPERVGVRFVGHEWRRGFIDGQLGWWGEHDVAVVRGIPVIDTRSAG